MLCCVVCHYCGLESSRQSMSCCQGGKRMLLSYCVSRMNVAFFAVFSLAK